MYEQLFAGFGGFVLKVAIGLVLFMFILWVSSKIVKLLN